MRWNRLPTDESEKGATIVEFALVLPLLILISFAIMEFGVAFYEYLSVERATNDGVRVAAFMGKREDADCQALSRVASALPGSMLDRVNAVEIFKASESGSQGVTNRYTPSGSGQDCGGVFWTGGGSWSPASRQTLAPTKPSDPRLDIVGLRIIVDRSWITGFGPFSGDYQINEYSLLRVEPDEYRTS